MGTTLQAVFLTMEMPIQAVLKAIDDAGARREVEAQFQEFNRTGKVRATLGEDDKDVRALYANEVLKTPLSSLDARWPREIGAKADNAPPPKVKAAPPPATAARVPKVIDITLPKAEAEPAPELKPAKAPKPPKPTRLAELPEGAPKPKQEKTAPRFTLDEDAPVEKAPSIGPKTAKRLEAVGVRTIADLLAANAEEAEKEIATRHISAQVIRDWQAQALLACTVPGLKSREAQALVACGVNTAEELAAFDASDLTEAVARWGISEEGARAWGSAPAPSESDVATWIERAKRAGKTTTDVAA
jgi:predicted flap endonuclease-1-like 5' DNA nuclease